MSGVLGHWLGRKKSMTFVLVNSVRYSVISCFPLRHGKYVYDWLKPSLASRYIIFGRVKASDRKSASGYSRFISVIAHSQNGNALVCGLSTRKMRTPCFAQKMKTSFNSCHMPRQSLDSKSNG